MILAMALAAATICEAPRVLDGDTIACAGGVRIRMSGIDTPELPGHCKRGRDCAPGDPFKSKQNLVDAMAGKVVKYRAIKRDVYNRTVAIVFADDVNLNCSQLSTARYVAKWDTGKHVATMCGVR